MGLFRLSDLFHTPRVHRVPKASKDGNEVGLDPELLLEEAVALLRPHQLPTCFGFRGQEATTQTEPTASRVWGEPYGEAGDDWPCEPSDGQPMVFLLQVNRAQLPLEIAIPDGLTVVFADAQHMESCEPCSGDGPLMVRHYAAPAAPTYVRLNEPPRESRPERPVGHELTFEAGLALPDFDSMWIDADDELYGPLARWLQAKEWLGSREALKEARRQLASAPSREPLLQVGGHPVWVQGAEPPDKGQLPHERFLMQINAASELGICWYDYGSIYLYTDDASLRARHAVFQCS
ncbi:MAG: DUF1963 domain-containing protein [Phycisphaeraceae bacterium]